MIITTRKIRAQYEHLLRVIASRDREVGMATEMLASTRWWRWSDRHRRSYAKGVIREASRRGLSAWRAADPFMWPPPEETDGWTTAPSSVKDLITDPTCPPRTMWHLPSEPPDDVVQ
jgi:hypothetical protein